MIELVPVEVTDDEPLYRQLYKHIKCLIDSGRLARGDRLPPTRELAGMLGWNRTTVFAAYRLLESEGYIRGHVGRGSYVEGPRRDRRDRVQWDELLRPVVAAPPISGMAPSIRGGISFLASRPPEDLFPAEAFRAACEEALSGPEAAEILQLGPPTGYPPLRRFLLESAEAEGVASAADDLLVTSGCQQAVDLLARVLLAPGDGVLLEDPVYPGLKNVFLQAGARVEGVPVGPSGVDLGALEQALRRVRPRLVVVTPNFQNPTGSTLPLEARRELVRLVSAAGAVLAENDIYGELRYAGNPLPSLKQLDDGGGTVLLRSYSKLTFPGLRVGWVIGPRPLVGRLGEAKQVADLHSCQLAQAALLRFALSGRLEAHRRKAVASGGQRLSALLEACQTCLPSGTQFTRPEGGMNLWVRLPAPLSSAELLAKSQQEGVYFLPGSYFEIQRHDPGALRLSFAALTPEEIWTGIQILGRLAREALEAHRGKGRWEPAPAVV